MKESKVILKENLTVKELNNVLKNGGVICFVTDTVWGLGCLPNNEKAVEKIYDIKGRDKSKPLILMSNKVENLFPFVENVSDMAHCLIKKYFPGALTLVMKKSDKTPLYITSNKDTVGIRVPDNEFFKELCECIDGSVLATTSANISNEPSSKTYEQAVESMGKLSDIVFFDKGFTCRGLESTVVLVQDDSFEILRQGRAVINLP